MCRIFGVVSDHVVSRKNLTRAAHQMHSGGPDSQWIAQERNWALGANRLAIQGIEGGEQPFRSGNFICVFNGEIYNHRELRAQMIEKGHSFTDSCDGNVILPLFQEYGADCVIHLEGMFTLAIFEMDRNGACVSAFLAADQSAMKTLFFTLTETGFYFASSIKALQSLAPDPFTVRNDFVYEYITRKAVWGPKTVYDDVQVLGAGETLHFDVASARTNIRSYKHVFERPSFDGLEDASDQLDALLHREIEKMVSMDVDFCSVLSGGLDSSYVTSIVKKFTKKLDAFHISYDSRWPGDESHFARMVAEQQGVTLHHIKVDVARLPDMMSEYVQHLDQPNYAPHCLSTYVLFKEINAAGYKVALTGEGADELFCGYSRLINAASAKQKDWFDNFYSIYGVQAFQNGSFFNADYFAEMQRKNGVPQLSAFPNDSRAQSILAYDQKTRFPYYILRRVDSLSMANSVEVRMPFLQPRVIDFAQNLPDDFLYSGAVGKQCVLRAGEKYLPQDVVHRKKQPFTFPVQQMMAETPSVRDYVFDTVFSQNAMVGDYFDLTQIQNLKSQDLNENDTTVLWALVVLQEWHTANTLLGA